MNLRHELKEVLGRCKRVFVRYGVIPFALEDVAGIEPSRLRTDDESAVDMLTKRLMAAPSHRSGCLAEAKNPKAGFVERKGLIAYEELLVVNCQKASGSGCGIAQGEGFDKESVEGLKIVPTRHI